jgi:hypothetical protein
MRKSVFAFATACVFGLTAPAGATVYNFTFNGTGLLHSEKDVGAGTFALANASTQVNGQTAFEIIGISGTVNNSSIVAPITATSDYGNYFTTGPAFLDGSGVKFATADRTNYDFFFQDPPSSQYRLNFTGPNGGDTAFPLTVSSSVVDAVPEPSTWAMMILGFAGIGAMTYRRRKSAMIAA